MRIPVIKGVIDRRILVNYRVDSAIMSRVLPAPFRPKLVGGYAIGGICLIRLKQIRPRVLPLAVGMSSENAAHRIAVEWTDGGRVREGVYIPRRDTSSRLNACAGGRVFPGEHHHARFTVDEAGDRFAVALESDDGSVHVSVVARPALNLPDSSIFSSLDEASRFFEHGSLGYSATRARNRFDGLELNCRQWSVTPLAVESLTSSFFDDRSTFPEGSIMFDCALLMRDVVHEWISREELCCTAG